MEVNLICSNQLKTIITELLNTRGIVVNPDTDIMIVEKKFEYNQENIAIIFDINTIEKLMIFLDELGVRKKNSLVISGKSNEGYEVLRYKDISYFEAVGNNVYAVNTFKKYKVKEKLYELEDKLKAEGFIRVSKSFVVNIVKIERINPWFNGKLLLKLNEPFCEIDVTRKYVKDFKNFLGL